MTAAGIIKLLGGVRASVFLSLALLLAVATSVQSCRLDRAKARADEWARVADAFQQTNAINVDTIGRLEQANEAWAGIAEQTQRKADQSVAAAEAERDRLAREIDERRQARETIYATDPDAAAWGRARVPARIASQLRK